LAPGVTGRRGLLLLLGLTALRLALAAILPLTPDEAYYWLWSRHVQPGYYDDAPLIAVWIKAGTALFGATPLGVRLFSPLGALAGSLLLWQAGNDFFSNRTDHPGLVAALLLNATLLLGAGAIITTPDTPLLLFWTATLAALARWHKTGDDRWWLAAGAAGGLAMDAKYTGLLIFAAAGLSLLTDQRGRAVLRRPWPWLGMLIGLVLFMPVLIWNARHHWVSLLKQGGRTAHLDLSHAGLHLADLILGQFGLATPLIAVLLVLGTLRASRAGDAGLRLLALSVVLPALIFLEHSLSGVVQGNWPAILYPGAALASAGTLGGRSRRWVAPAAVLGFAITALVYGQVLTRFIALPPARDPIALQMRGWRAWSAEAARQAHGDPIIATDYATIAELDWGLPAQNRLIAAGPRWRWFALPHPPPARSALLIQSNRRGPPSPALFSAITKLGPLNRQSRGVTVQAYTLYRVTLRANAPAALLRRPQRR
jgi:4-amino-4-deoxy-L-arabinose transferase-like glycosyltransferase